jgi:hypothetical protein
MGEDVPKVFDCSFLAESELVDADGFLENVGTIGLFKSEMFMLTKLKVLVNFHFPEENLRCAIHQGYLLERGPKSLFKPGF